MSYTTTTPNMGLVKPTPTQELGPAYAVELNNDLDALDAHNHAPGFGLPVPVSGMNFNEDVDIGGHALTDAEKLQMQDGDLLAGAADVGCCFEHGGELYYNDASGNHVQMTSGGFLNASALIGAGITGLTGTASASYSTGSGFSWKATPTTGAQMNCGPVSIQDTSVANGNSIVLIAPAALPASLTFTWPSAFPSSGTKFIRVSSSGVLSDNTDVDSATLEIASVLGVGQVLRVKAAGVGTSQIAVGGVTGANLGAGAVTRDKLATLNAANGMLLSASGTGTGAAYLSGTWTDVTNLNCDNVTVSGRPLLIECVPDPVTADSDDTNMSGWYIGSSAAGFATADFRIVIYNGGTIIKKLATMRLGGGNGYGGNQLGVFSPGAVKTLLSYLIPGSWSFKVQTRVSSGITSGYVNPYNMRLLVFEQ